MRFRCRSMCRVHKAIRVLPAMCRMHKASRVLPAMCRMHKAMRVLPAQLIKALDKNADEIGCGRTLCVRADEIPEIDHSTKVSAHST